MVRAVPSFPTVTLITPECLKAEFPREVTSVRDSVDEPLNRESDWVSAKALFPMDVRVPSVTLVRPVQPSNMESGTDVILGRSADDIEVHPLKTAVPEVVTDSPVTAVNLVQSWKAPSPIDVIPERFRVPPVPVSSVHPANILAPILWTELSTVSTIELFLL